MEELKRSIHVIEGGTKLKKLGYEPRLEELEAFRNRSKDGIVDLKQLCAQIKITTNIHFLKDIFAMLSIGKHYTLVIYEDTVRLVDKPTSFLRNLFIEYQLNMESEGYKKTIYFFEKKKIHRIPLVCENYSLIPFSAADGSCHDDWISPNCIAYWEQKNPVTIPILYLKNDFRLSLDRQRPALLKLMERGFVAQALYQRSLQKGAVPPNLSLLEYLNLEPFQIIREALGDKEFCDLPYYGVDFHKMYRRYHDEIVSDSVKKGLYEDLDIEE